MQIDVIGGDNTSIGRSLAPHFPSSLPSRSLARRAAASQVGDLIEARM